MFIQSSLVLPIHPFRSSDCIEVRLGTQAGPEGAEPGQIQAGLSRWEALSWQRAWPGMELARGCGGCLPHRAQSCRGVRPSGVRWWVLRCTGARLTLPGDCRGGGTGGTQEAAQESRGSPLPAGGIGPLGPTADRPATWRATCLLVMNDCSSLLTLLPTVRGARSPPPLCLGVQWRPRPRRLPRSLFFCQGHCSGGLSSGRVGGGGVALQ